MSNKVKPRNEILTDIIRDAKKYPKGWQATFGKDEHRLSHDYYIFNPNAGVYLLKEYHKNPFEVKGLGSKVARRIDADINDIINKKTGDFGIIQGDIRKILFNIEKGVPPQTILSEALKGRDYGIQIPVRGKACSSKEMFSHLKSSLSVKQRRLNDHFEKMISEDGVYTSYR